MDIEKKRALFFGSLLVLAVLGATILFLWGNLIDRGNISVSGDSPFTVEIAGLSKQDCLVSPCLIKTKSGRQDLAISKSGFKSTITSVNVKLWGTVDLPISFDLIPHIEETTSIPEPLKKSELDLVIDHGNNMQKLIKKNNPSIEALAYFPKPISKFQIIDGNNSALILDLSSVDNPAYIVNFDTKKREEISQKDLLGLVAGAWSDDGKYLVFSKKNSPLLWLMNVGGKSVNQLQLITNLKEISWAYNDILLFVTDQTYSSSGNGVNLLDAPTQNGVTFGTYDAINNQYSVIGNFPEVLSLPNEFISTTNGNTIYFTINKKNFKITLRKI